jgi:hypothetical protein
MYQPRTIRGLLRIRGPLRLSFSAFVLLASVAGARATVIDFNTLGGNNLDPFISYAENGFTVAATSGTWNVAKVLGNPAPDILARASAGTVTITKTGSGPFNFLDVDLVNGNVSGSINYIIQGFLGVTQQFTESGMVGTTFTTIASVAPSDVIDSLVITESNISSSANVDNIQVSVAVPAPPVGRGLPALLGVWGVLAAARVLERQRRMRRLRC